MPRQKQRTGEMRDRVLSAAVEILTTDGVAGLTARRVAHDAQTSTPANRQSPYKYFDAKSVKPMDY